MSGIDLSRSPYFDDFDANNNYYQVLFRPSVAVQTRELNQVQSIFQDQITKFGRHIFKDGSVTEGCAFSFDKNYSFVKISDNYSNGSAFIITDFYNMYAVNKNGLQAVIVNTVPGYETQDPDTNTLYIKYLNSTTYSNGAQQTTFDSAEELMITTPDSILIGNVVVFTPNIANPSSVSTGLGYAFTTGTGTIYKNGYFISVEQQTIIVDKYDNVPNGVSIGFLAIDNIVTPESNTSLYDNSIGSPNYSAPGAHRYQLIPTLTLMQTNNITNSTPFFSLCDFQSGAPITIKNDPQYNILGAEMARRTYETNGDYVVNPFILTVESKPETDPLYLTYDNLIASRGLGYVKGYRNEFINNVTVPIEKAITFANALSITTASFGCFIDVNEYVGDFGNVKLSLIELHNVAKKAVSTNKFLSVDYSASTLIGHCYLRGFSYNSGFIGTGSDQYNAYLFDIQMIPGYSFFQVQSLIRRGVAQNLAVADAIRTGITQTPVTLTLTSTSTSLETTLIPTTETVSNTVAIVTAHTTTNGFWSSTIASLPAAICVGAACLVNSSTVMFAGGVSSGGQAVSNTYFYDIPTNSWRSTAPLLAPEWEIGLAKLSNGNILAIGGARPIAPPNGVVPYCDMYNVTTNTWVGHAAVPSLPYPAVQFGLATISNGSILIIGGLTQNSGSTTTNPYDWSANTFRYDPGVNIWTIVAPLPFPMNSLSSAALANDLVLCFGGQTSSGTGAVGNVYAYSPGANTWAKFTELPKPMLEVQAATLPNNSVLVFSGADQNGTVLSDAYIFDPSANTWKTAQSLPKAFFQATSEPATMPNGSILSMGGRTSTSTYSNMTDCYLYDPTVDVWYSTTYQTVNTEITVLKAVTTPVTTTTTSSTTSISTSVSTEGVQTALNMMIFPLGQKALKLDGFTDQSYVYRKSALSTFNNLTSGQMSISLGSTLGSAIETFDFGGYLSAGAEESFIIIPPAGGTTNNKDGTVSITANGNIVTGKSTSFTIDYYSGDYISVSGVTSQINSITNDTFMSITSLYPSGVSDTTHFKVFPPGVPIDFTKSRRSVVVTNNTAIFTLGESLNGAFNATTYFDVLRSYTVPIQKKLKNNVYVAINCASHPNGTVGPWSLGFVDVLRINAIYVNDDGSFSNTTPDFSSLFYFDNGQRDDHYELSSIEIPSSYFSTNTRILVDLTVFSYDQSQGIGYFNANSYPVDDVNSSNTSAIQIEYIPEYVSSSGTKYDLRDCVDFRPFANNSANNQANSTNWLSVATINPDSNLIFYVNPTYGSFLPSPDSNYIANIEFYLPRIDKAVLTTDGNLNLLNGIPSIHPVAPMDSSTTMTLGIVNVPPYPSLSTPDAKLANRYDYAITISLTQNKRYTMRDVNTLSNRIDQLEYYTSLNLLEKSAQSLLITTGSTGQNRFQNGFLADPFVGFDISDTLDPTFNCTIDAVNGEMRPAISTFTKAIWTDQADLPFNTSDYIFQNYSSMAINCSSTPYDYHSGRIEFYPQLFCAPDYFHNPDVVNNLTLESSWINIPCRPNPGPQDYRNPYGTDWGHWRHYNPNILSTQTLDNGYQSRNVSLNQISVGALNTSSGSFTTDGIFVDTNVIDYTKQRDLMFIARGIKPNTKVRLFCGTYDLTAYCRQCSKGFAEETFGYYNNNVLLSNAIGYIYGKITLPSGYFKSSSLQFTFCDDPDIMTTRADGYCHTSFTDQSNWMDIDITDEVGGYGYFTGVSQQFASSAEVIVLNNTSFLNTKQIGDNNLKKMNTYFQSKGISSWQRYPNKTGIAFPSDDDWNPSYIAQEGFHSTDRKGQDVPRVSYGVVPRHV